MPTNLNRIKIFDNPNLPLIPFKTIEIVGIIKPGNIIPKLNITSPKLSLVPKDFLSSDNDYKEFNVSKIKIFDNLDIPLTPFKTGEIVDITKPGNNFMELIQKTSLHEESSQLLFNYWFNSQ